MSQAQAQDGDGTAETLHILGPTVEILTVPEAGDTSQCVMRGTIPPGVVIPLHRHADPETFVVLSGEVEGLIGGTWEQVGPGDFVHVPGDVPHGWRNTSHEPAVMYIVSTAKIARFFRELARAPEELAAIADRYGYWNATPEESAAAGL